MGRIGLLGRTCEELRRSERHRSKNRSQRTMQRLTRREGLDLRAPRSQRSSSISNDRASLSVASLPFPPAVQPDPAYIAPSSASQIVTGDQEPALDEEVDEEGMDGMGAMNAWVAPNALSLVNAFLDQLLFSFLASSRSTSIASLRPAVSEVLKPRLAKDAIACADAELQEFLGGEDGDESVFQHGLEPRGQWDLHTIWRRTRLRCMVYTRLGDLEEEDEEMWIEREDLDLDYRTDSRNRLSRDLGVVSPAAAIFLTSILEFIGEEILRVAGKAAYTRLEARRRQEKHTPEQAIDLGRLSVEVVDIEKLAANTTFGRLWRSWKKKVRSPSITSQRPSSRELLRRPASSMSSSEPRSRKASVGESGVHVADAGAFQRPSTAEDRERTFEAAAVPLPVTRDDASEIEGRPPATWASPAGSAERPRSMGMGYGSYQSANVMNADCSGDTLHSRPRLLQHHRSSSLPHLTSKQSPSAHISRFSTPRDDPSLVALQDSPRGYSHDDSDPPAVATIDDGVIEHDGGAARVGEKEAAEQSDMAAYEQEMRDIDAGLDSLAKASNEHQAIDKQAPSSTISNNDDRRGQDRWPVSERVAVRGSGAATKLSQQLPLSSMQGYAKENASLDKREASVVEPIPSQVFGNKGLISQGVSDETASHYREDENTPAELRDLFSYAGNDQFGGATSTIRDINTRNYGSVHRSHPDANANTVRSSSPTFAQAKGPAVSGIRKQLPPVSTGVERAAVQRVSASPVSPMESPFGRTSTSSNRELRALHKSSSSASHRAAKLKGLVGIQSSDTNRQSAVSRTSSDGSASIAVRTPKRDETQQSFEDLIKSDETIQYTLTPPTVRDIDVSRCRLPLYVYR